MSISRPVLALIAALAGLAPSGAAWGQTEPATDAGRYTVAGFHDPADSSYEAAVGSTRSFFVFDLSGLPVAPILSATLELDVGSVTQGGFGGISYTLFDVTTPIGTLVAGGSGLTGIYADLGSGTSYSTTIDIAPADQGGTKSIPLLPAGIAALEGAAGGLVAIGGAPTGLGGNFAFGGTSVLGASLVIDFPAPGCSSSDPNDWPASARPYFLVIADTSGSMTACTNPPTSYPQTCGPSAPPNRCGLVPTRYNDLKCALDQATSAYSGLARFGLSTFATYIDGCAAGQCVPACSPLGGDCDFETYGCNLFTVPGDLSGCGPGTGATREGSILRVPIARDHIGATNQEPSNAQSLLGWLDGDCTGDIELHAGGPTPINGALRDAKRYLETGLTNPVTSVFHPTPLDAADLPCRSVNVILVTDGDENCDSHLDAVSAASDLFQNGVTVGANTYAVRTWVVNLAGANPTGADQIAGAGGTGSSLFATNEIELSQALNQILVSAQASETCDNVDNDCNGCVDEGFVHYANQGQTCCAWSTPAERDACLASYLASIANEPPDGDTSLLPCTTLAQQADPATWLCYDAGELCDGVDNNGVLGVDENQLRCGEPLQCPTAEVCNGIDDDCNGQVDDGVCGACISSPEVCDGCDNDCDGWIDNGSFADIPCGLSEPANCGDVRSCMAPQAAPELGACLPGAGYGSCGVSPQPEVADGLDNDCNGAIDDGLPPADCEPAGTPPGLVYGGTSQCQLGQQYVSQPCTGFVGPSVEVSDGVDNDCNGVVDDLGFFPPGLPLLGPVAVLLLALLLAGVGARRLRGT